MKNIYLPLVACLLFLFSVTGFAKVGTLTDMRISIENDQVLINIVYNSVTDDGGKIYIEKSTDKIEFDTLDRIDATFGSGISATIIDKAPHLGVNHYRLTMSYEDDVIIQTEWLVIHYWPEYSFKVKDFANPVAEANLRLEIFSNDPEVVKIEILDMQGKSMIGRQSHAIENINIIELATAGLPKGFYVLMVYRETADEQKMVKFYKT